MAFLVALSMLINDFFWIDISISSESFEFLISFAGLTDADV
jgi:hypothetical protein